MTGIREITVPRIVNIKIVEVILAIGFFFILWLSIVALCLSLSAGLAYLGYYLIASMDIKLLAVVMAIILWLIGATFFIFLVRFISTKSRDENPHRIEVFAADQPELFSFIGEVSEQVGTYFPKRLFLSHSVTASVFYDSSFWSLFYRSGKNLELGLGLINTLNVSELKAVLAHEFGHFSQKSMRLGSYVYSANRIIYNLVYDHNNWDKTLQRWADTGGLYGFFSLTTSVLVHWMSPLLRRAYNLINLPYMTMSREMEYHADQISAIVAGKENAISALRRIEFADAAFVRTSQILYELAMENQVSENIYPDHLYVIKRFGKYYNLRFENGLPTITDRDIEVNAVKSRVIFKDQWASHPKRKEREKVIRSIKVTVKERDTRKAWILLNNAEECQKKVTLQLYTVDFGDLEEKTTINHRDFKKFLRAERTKYRIDKIFEGYYDSRYLYPLDPDKMKLKMPAGDIKRQLSEIYSRETKVRSGKLQFDYNDISTIHAIKQRAINTRYFEFDGKKYHRKEVDKVIAILEKDIRKKNKELRRTEVRAFKLNLAAAAMISAEEKDRLVQEYKRLIAFEKNSKVHEVFMERINSFQQVLYSRPSWWTERLNAMNVELSHLEKDYKSFLEEMNMGDYDNISKRQMDILEEYMQEGHYYILVSEYDAERFQKFLELIYENHDFISYKYLLELKKVTDLQKGIYERTGISWDIGQ